MRLLVAGLTASERSTLQSTAEAVMGTHFQLIATPPIERRAALFEGFDPDDPSLCVISEHLDAAFETPLLVGGCTPWCDSAELTDVLSKAVDAHIAAYGLRDPISPCTAWDPERAHLASHWAIDGALVGDGSETWWDVSEIAVFDGVVDEALRRSLISLLSAGPEWDAESGADPRVWERGTFTDVDQGDARGGGWGLNEEATERLCAEPASAPVAELQARVARLVGEAANGGHVSVCRMAASVLGDAITPLAANAPVATDEDLFSWHIVT